MDIENTNQPSVPIEGSNQKQSSLPEDQPRQPKKFIIILGIIIALFSFGLGGYFLGTNRNKSTSQYQQAIPSPSNTIQPSSTNTLTPIENSTINWKEYTSEEGKYSIRYPQDWVVEVYKEKYPYNTSYGKGYIVFQSRATTSKEKADDVPGLPIDMGTGSIRIITTDSMRGLQYAKISEQDFFNPNNDFWPKGNAGGGGPGTTYSIPEEVSIGGKKAMKQTAHPTTAYEWVGPNQITTNYYVWLGNSANEVVEISFAYDNQNPNKDTLIKNFNQMISTFKLTN